MTPHDKAIEAAAKAIYDGMYAAQGGLWRCVETKDVWHKKATVAITAYLAALEAEGGARRGNCMIWHEGKDNECWACDTVPSNNPKHIPVLIIKDCRLLTPAMEGSEK
jgi:hypothetical protein